MLYHGDCLEVLKTLEPNSVDSLVTDPPAGISFMNKGWDDDKGGRDHWIKWLSEVMRECMRVMKPGAHGLVWALPRTSHWTTTALENAGFEVRDIINHLFGSGFPKSLNIGKAIDKMKGAEREVISTRKLMGKARNLVSNEWVAPYSEKELKLTYDITEPSTDEAKQWEGWGTSLKPAVEHWILIRKPLSEKNVALNVIKHGCGGINIDESRISSEPIPCQVSSTGSGYSGSFSPKDYPGKRVYTNQGRFPANLILSHNPDCVLKGEKNVGKGELKKCNTIRKYFMKEKSYNEPPTPTNYGTETIASYECTEGCAVKELDEQIGGASSFFYCSKTSTSDRNEGLDKNHHPTVKSTKLMSYLIKLITKPGGIVLDPFMGSGSTGKAAIRNNFEFIGIEKELEYFEIAKARIDFELSKIKQMDFEEGA